MGSHTTGQQQHYPVIPPGLVTMATSPAAPAGVGARWASLPGPAWAAVLRHVRRGGYTYSPMADFASLACTCKAFGEAVRAHQPAATYLLHGTSAQGLPEGSERRLAHAEACGRHLAKLTAPDLEVYIRASGCDLCAFFRGGGGRSHPTVTSVRYEGLLDAASALLLGQAFPSIKALRGGTWDVLTAGNEAALRGIGASWPNLQDLEFGVTRLADLAGVRTCSALRRLRVVLGHSTGADDPAALGVLTALSSLETLQLDSRAMAPGLLQPLTGLQRLTSFVCGWCGLDGHCLAVLGQLPALTHMTVCGKLTALEAVEWQLPHLTQLTHRIGQQGGLTVVDAGVIASRCPMLCAFSRHLVVRAEDEGQQGELRRCVRALHTLEARGLLADCYLTLRCSPAALQAAWAAELGALGREVRLLGVRWLFVGSGLPAQEPADSGRWPWLFACVPRVHTLTCPEAAVCAAVVCLTELQRLSVPSHMRASLHLIRTFALVLGRSQLVVDLAAAS